MEIFDKCFVHFMWDDELEGKVCFVANNMKDLIFAVENDGNGAVKTNALRYSGNNVRPFHAYMLGANCSYPFAYYDPNYSIKKAFNEGKMIQYQLVDELNWRDVEDENAFERLLEEGRVFRIKPEEEQQWIVYLARVQDGVNYLACCFADVWTTAQRADHAKTKLFVGTHDEARNWIYAHRRLIEIIKAWEDGKTVQFRNPVDNNWVMVIKPTWETDIEYRVKPEEPEEKKYRPYESSAEMIADFMGRFKVKCPSYCEPLVWVKSKDVNRQTLVSAFREDNVSIDFNPFIIEFEQLFNDYIYLDGSPCGMKCLVKND